MSILERIQSTRRPPIGSLRNAVRLGMLRPSLSVPPLTNLLTSSLKTTQIARRGAGGGIAGADSFRSRHSDIHGVSLNALAHLPSQLEVTRNLAEFEVGHEFSRHRNFRLRVG